MYDDHNHENEDNDDNDDDDDDDDDNKYPYFLQQIQIIRSLWSLRNLRLQNISQVGWDQIIRTLKVSRLILLWILNSTGKQCNCFRKGQTELWKHNFESFVNNVQDV